MRANVAARIHLHRLTPNRKTELQPNRQAGELAPTLSIAIFNVLGVTMGKILVRIFCVAVLIGAILNFTMVFETSPAFNSNARDKNVGGNWRVPNAAAHYDKSEYLLELAYSFLNELDLTYDPATGDAMVISIEEQEARTQKALDLINRSIRLDPANASGWTYLAQAQARAGDIDDMRDSLKRSWELAPYNVQLAPLRLQLVMQVYHANLHLPEQVATLSDQEIAAAYRDGTVLNAQSPIRLERLMPDEDPVRSLLGDFGIIHSNS